MFFYMSITYCVVHVFTCAVIASAAVPHLGPIVPFCGSAVAMEQQCRGYGAAVPHPVVIEIFVVHELSFASQLFV